MTTADPRPMSSRFKEGCWDLHQSAESGDFARRMIAGTLDRQAYVRMLEQMYAALAPLDEAIKANRSKAPALAALVDDSQLHGPRLIEDLRYFGVDPASIEPGPGARQLAKRVESMARENPVLLLGLHYVREGANNGNHFVAKKLRGVLGLPERDGTRHLDPYGADQRANWEAWRHRLDAHPFSAEEKDALVASARDMFKAIIAIHNELDAAAPVAG